MSDEILDLLVFVIPSQVWLCCNIVENNIIQICEIMPFYQSANSIHHFLEGEYIFKSKRYMIIMKMSLWCGKDPNDKSKALKNFALSK